MFRQLPNYLSTDNISFTPALPRPEDLFNRHPMDIASYMEAFWEKRYRVSQPLGHPDNLSDELGLPGDRLPLPILRPVGTPIPRETLWGFDSIKKPPIPAGNLRWDHLIYAYMIENTRIYEIFRRVIYEYRSGERLGTPQNAETQNWLRNTEELFYSDTSPFMITNVSSHIRSDLRANRRNAYHRMFGMDLNHGADDGKPYAFQRAEASNLEFVPTFEEFLREVWVAMTYVTATSSASPTDDSKISGDANRSTRRATAKAATGHMDGPAGPTGLPSLADPAPRVHTAHTS